MHSSLNYRVISFYKFIDLNNLEQLKINFYGFLKKNDLADVLIISDSDSLKNINKSARNIKDLKIISENGANIYDMMKYKNVLLTQSSIKNLEKRILNEKN